MHEVQLMKCVYSNTQETCVSLGPEKDDSGFAMAVIKAADNSDIDRSSNWVTEADVHALKCLRARS